MTEHTVLERVTQIRNKHGLHARPAAELVKLATQFRAEITIRKDTLEVNGKSIMGILMLAAEYGSELTIRAAGEDAEAALAGLVNLIEKRFGED
jgi:phosphocarrier protein HPr